MNPVVETKTDEVEHRRQEVRQAVKNACDRMRIEGVPPRDYVEQITWLFFLKSFEEAENNLAFEADFEGKEYERRLDGEYRWSEWAKKTDRPEEMLTFVNGKLFPHLQNLGDDALGAKFNRIFSTVKNHQSRPASFAQVVAQIDRLHFSEKTDVDVLSEIYESLLKDVAAVSGYAGEFYTPRHIIRLMVKTVKPKLGDQVYDPCFGSAGFLVETARLIRESGTNWSGADVDRFHKETFYGRELGALAYLMGTMNLIMHDVHDANLELVNTLETHSNDVPEAAKYDVILANPPYGGKLGQQTQTNFTVRSGATEVLFLQHIMKNLARKGRAGVVVPEGVLFRGGPDQKVRERLLREFDVHTVLSLPAGVFLPYTGVKTNIIFFDRPETESADEIATKAVWFYELTNDGFELKQTRRPIEGEQISDFLEKQPARTESENSWLVPFEEIEKRGYDLSAKNPNRQDDYEHRPALDLVQSIKSKADNIFVLLDELNELLDSSSAAQDTIGYSIFGQLDEIPMGWREARLDALADVIYGVSAAISGNRDSSLGTPIIRMANMSLDGKLDLSDLRYLPLTESQKDKFLLKPGDLLLNWRSGSPAHIGKTALFSENGEFACASFILRIRAYGDKCNNRYLRHILNFMRESGFFERKQRMQINAKLNASEFSSFMIRIPPTLKEQEIIADKLDLVESVCNRIHSESFSVSSESNLLKIAIRRKAFAGEL